MRIDRIEDLVAVRTWAHMLRGHARLFSVAGLTGKVHGSEGQVEEPKDWATASGSCRLSDIEIGWQSDYPQTSATAVRARQFI